MGSHHVEPCVTIKPDVATKPTTQQRETPSIQAQHKTMGVAYLKTQGSHSLLHIYFISKPSVFMESLNLQYVERLKL